MSVMVVAVPVLCVSVGLTRTRRVGVLVRMVVDVHYQFYCTSLPVGLQPPRKGLENEVIGKYDTTGERIR